MIWKRLNIKNVETFFKKQKGLRQMEFWHSPFSILNKEAIYHIDKIHPMKKEMSYIGLVLIVFLVLSLLNMPYGFYNLIRFVVSIYFAVLSYSFYKQDKKKETIITQGNRIKSLAAFWDSPYLKQP